MMSTQQPPIKSQPVQDNNQQSRPQLQSHSIQKSPPQAQVSATPSSLDVNNLGYFLDGWADIIEGMGEKADQVRKNAYQGLVEREMPSIKIINLTGVVGLIANEKRGYTITTTSPGATTAVYISSHGKDLYASWRTFIKPVLNSGYLLVIMILSSVFALWWLGSGVNVRYMSDYIDYFTEWFSFGGWLWRAAVLFFLGCGLLGFIGRIFKGNALAYFFIEPTIFDADDIAAMSLSAHKSILRALDSAGIDVSKLRLKQNFKGGRRGEDV